MIRKPAVAGTFYPGNKESLREEIEECFLHPLGPGRIPSIAEKSKDKIFAIISPHAGYVYSGPVAAWGFACLMENENPETIIILGPNHRGFGRSVAIMTEGEWETPLGKVPIDEDLAKDILQASPLIEEDEKAHQREHSLEVQLPFLQYGYKDNFKIVPICFTDQTFVTSVGVGKAIFEVIKEKNGIALVASTDLTHYQPRKIAERDDRNIIEAILTCNPESLRRVLSSGDYSMCGYGPVFALMQVALSFGSVKARLLKYATSGDITGDYSAVVGYASLSLEK
ncbi:AmmeMemoRadiSam system protein B [Candidatus Aerophobetes bacterium]|nr:AmmeMemoRadiSam system protein B [Candidatus Aerophobetes bacterium]